MKSSVQREREWGERRRSKEGRKEERKEKEVEVRTKGEDKRRK